MVATQATQEKTKKQIAIDLWKDSETWGGESINSIIAQVDEQLGTEVSSRNIKLVAMQLAQLGWKGLPYVHTRTFEGWRAAGRQVRKGEKSKILSITWIAGEEGESKRYPKVTNLFHFDQTDAIDGEKDETVPPIAAREPREVTTDHQVRERKPRGKTAGLAVIQTGVEVSENKEKGGIEIRFAAKPAGEVIAQLKDNGFRWSRTAGCWYTRTSDSDSAKAKAFAYALKVEED